MAANTPTILGKKSQEGLLAFEKQCYTLLTSQWNVREQMREIDLVYMREQDQLALQKKAKLANRYGDSSKFQNVTVPVVMPAVESAVVYQSSVFLSGEPIFGCVAPPQYEDAAQQMEAILGEQSTKGGWIRHLQMFLRDGFKYNTSAIEVSWEDRKVPSYATDMSFDSGKQAKMSNIIWSGNTLKRLDPYNTIWDVRVPITQVSEHGEFVGYTELMSRIRLKMYITSLPNKMVDNVAEAFRAGGAGYSGTNSTAGTYYIPPINNDALVNLNLRGSMDWMAWAAASGTNNASLKDQKNVFEVTTIYARICPIDFSMSVPSRTEVQIWKLVFVNHQVLIYAERQNNAHDRLPVLFGQPLEDGLSYQTKSFAKNIQPIQDVSSALMNSVIASRRRAISDRGLYDPTRVSEHNINSDNPAAKIPVRPAAYGKPLNEAYYPIPFNDNQSGVSIQEIGNLMKMGEMISGQNPARQGQFVKGNKTQTEYSDVMNNSNGRDQNTSILLEAQVFTPLKEILKANILQFQGPASVYNPAKQQLVNIDPIKLRQAIINFKITDGLAPASKVIGGDALQTSLQVIGSSPQIGAGYNIGPMFSYLMKTQGAHITEFEKSKEQVAYEQASQQWLSMAQLAVQKGEEWKIPQPTPEQFGYLVNGQLKQTEEPVDALATFQQSLAQTAAQAPAQATQGQPLPTT